MSYLRSVARIGSKSGSLSLRRLEPSALLGAARNCFSASAFIAERSSRKSLRARSLYIISVYPAQRIEPTKQQKILEHVRAGSGLLMIGGWDSFHGSAGGWDHTPVGEALPVEIDSHDDRVNCDQPALVRCAKSH